MEEYKITASQIKEAYENPEKLKELFPSVFNFEKYFDNQIV